jgi:predicted P-loop ATPase
MSIAHERVESNESHTFDAYSLWEAKSPEEQLGEILRTFRPSDWVKEPALSVLARFRHDPLKWAYIVLIWRERDRFMPVKLLTEAVDAYLPKKPSAKRPTTDAVQHEDWESLLLCTKDGEPKQVVNNICLFLEHDSPWHTDLWFDEVRQIAMVGTEPLADPMTTTISRWLGDVKRMSVYNLKLVGSCVESVCQKHPKDLLREWIDALPAWDGQERLLTWLHECAGTPKTAYTQEVSRLIPVSMMARALDPGCVYRYVVMLEGEERTGKSSLVRTLATREWLYECGQMLEGKESYMIIQGHWVAELPELHAMKKTDEPRFKGFISQVEDKWIPKYSNSWTRRPRRTIFIGTLNPSAANKYLRGDTGNTRYLPIPTGAIQPELLEQCRVQLFAEAKAYYLAHPKDWWQLSAEAEEAATGLREDRRVTGPYEGPRLERWLEEVIERTKFEPREAAKIKVDTRDFLATVPFHIHEAMEECFHIPPERRNETLENAVGKAIGKVEGWYSRRSRVRGYNGHHWYYKGLD